MKYLCLLFAVSSLCLLPACEKKGPIENAGEKVDDALDQRPAEKVRDKAEDAADAVKDATN